VNKVKGFWNDRDGITISDIASIITILLYLFVGIKLAISKNLTANQVDFFSILSYPILAIIAKQAIERVGFPSLGRRPPMVPQQTYTYSTVQEEQDTNNQPSI
jgi:hypothetical protein